MSMADDILEGIFCDECGQYIGEPVGYPRKCNDCKPQKKKHNKGNKRRTNGNAQQQVQPDGADKPLAG